MPIYEYVCKTCGNKKEILQKIDEPPPKCCNCDTEMAKQISLSSFVLKGTGWYKTDYANKNKK